MTANRSPYTFSAVVMDRGAGDRWRSAALDDFANRGIRIVGEQMLIGSEFVGFGRFSDLEAADPPLASWIAVGPRDFVGQPVGLFEWTHPNAEPDQINAVVTAVAHGTRGAILRRDVAALRETVVLREFRLDQAGSEFGFECGEALLERTPGRYVEYVLGEMRARLGAAKLEPGGLGLDPEAYASQNPLRIYPPLVQDGVEVDASRFDLTLAREHVEIWAYRRDLYSPLDEFWFD